MKECMECGYKFTFSDRLKMFFNLKGNITCHKCKSVYREKFNFYRGIYYGLITFVSMMIFFEINLNNYILKWILYGITNFIISSYLILYLIGYISTKKLIKRNSK